MLEKLKTGLESVQAGHRWESRVAVLLHSPAISSPSLPLAAPLKHVLPESE